MEGSFVINIKSICIKVKISVFLVRLASKVFINLFLLLCLIKVLSV